MILIQKRGAAKQTNKQTQKPSWLTNKQTNKQSSWLTEEDKLIIGQKETKKVSEEKKKQNKKIEIKKSKNKKNHKTPTKHPTKLWKNIPSKITPTPKHLTPTRNIYPQSPFPLKPLSQKQNNPLTPKPKKILPKRKASQLPLLPALLWIWRVVPVRLPSTGQIQQFDYLQRIHI